jgi:hypothetical protein
MHLLGDSICSTHVHSILEALILQSRTILQYMQSCYKYGENGKERKEEYYRN